MSTAHANHDGHGAVDEDGADRDEEQQPIGDGIEDLAELGGLVEVAGDVAVEEVGGAEHAEEPRRRCPVLLVEQQPEEHGQAQQPHDGDDVGIVRTLSALAALAARSSGITAESLRSEPSCRRSSPASSKASCPGGSCTATTQCVAFLSIAPMRPGPHAGGAGRGGRSLGRPRSRPRRRTSCAWPAAIGRAQMDGVLSRPHRGDHRRAWRCRTRTSISSRSTARPICTSRTPTRTPGPKTSTRPRPSARGAQPLRRT